MLLKNPTPLLTRPSAHHRKNKQTPPYCLLAGCQGKTEAFRSSPGPSSGRNRHMCCSCSFGTQGIRELVTQQSAGPSSRLQQESRRRRQQLSWGGKERTGTGSCYWLIRLDQGEPLGEETCHQQPARRSHEPSRHEPCMPMLLSDALHHRLTHRLTLPNVNSCVTLHLPLSY